MKNKKDIILQNLDLKNGKVTYNDFDIDPELPFEKQELSFKEDLLQIHFEKEILIDVGWYPDFKPSGSFVIYILWDNSDLPIIQTNLPLVVKEWDKITYLSPKYESLIVRLDIL